MVSWDKVFHGMFTGDVEDVADGWSCQWLRAWYLGKGTERFGFFLAQEQALMTRFFQATNEKGEHLSQLQSMCNRG